MPDPIDGKIRILFEEGKVSARLCVAPGPDPSELSVETLVNLLQERTVHRGAIDTKALGELLEAFGADPSRPAEAVVARGRAPVHGVNGYFEMDPELTESWEKSRRRIETVEEERARLEAEGSDNEAAVSFYERSAFCMVSSGQRLGRVVPPTVGEEGLDVTGSTLPPRTGKPFAFAEHDSITVAQDGTVTANNAGYLRHSHDVLQVLRVLEIEGSVDFSTGNVTGFDGDVQVRRGVKDNFRVEVGGVVAVGELVEAAHIGSGRDVVLSMGMAGREKGTLRVGRDLTAKYLDAVHAEVRRDAIIARELTNVRLSVGRNLVGPKAKIVGGSIAVVRCCEAGQVGSEAGALTEIILGKLPEQERLAREAFELIPALEKRQAKRRERLVQLVGAGLQPTGRQAQELETLKNEIATDEKRIEPLRARIAGLLRGIDRLAIGPSLVVHKVLHQDAVVCVGPFRCRIETAVRGPVRVDLGPDGQPRLTGLDTGSSQPLSTIASLSRDERFVDLSAVREAFDALAGSRAGGAEGERSGRAA